MKHVLFAVLAICFVIAGMTNDGQAFRCGNELVEKGDSVIRLRAKCGEPGYKDFATEKINDRWESVEKWSYNCGANDFIYVLTIIGSTIVSEETAGRGFGVSECQGRR